MRQTWLSTGRSGSAIDEAHFLASVSGWAVGCFNEEEAGVAFAWALRNEWIAKRVHVAPAGTWDAWRLTRRGWDRLREIGSEEQCLQVHRQLAFYGETVR